MNSYLVFILSCLGLLACGGLEESLSSKALSATWTPQYESIVEYWNMTTAQFSDGARLPAQIGDAGTIKNSNGSGMAAVSGPVSFALHFDGVDDRIEFPFRNNNNLNLFSVSLWIRLDPGTGERFVLTSRDAPVAKGYAFYVDNNHRPEVHLGRGTTDSWGTATGTGILNNTWTHIVFSYDGTYLRLYQNGVLQASQLTAFSPNTSRPLYVGAGSTEQTPLAADFFPGDIDEVAIWGSVLSDSQVLEIYQRQTP